MPHRQHLCSETGRSDEFEGARVRSAGSLAIALGLLAPAVALAQATDDEEEPHGPPAAAAEPDVDRPLARALAFERRDAIAELLFQPTRIDAVSLARDALIPERHAGVLIEAARSGTPIDQIRTALELGLPEAARARAGAHDLTKLSQAELVERSGLTERQAREFVRYRRSARRVELHFREVVAVREAEATRAERSGRGPRGPAAERIHELAERLGLRAEPTAERTRPSRRGRPAERIEITNDPFVELRRGDGTIDWKKFSAREAATGVGGLAHFAFSLFLKELALVLSTGDYGRLEEFVDGLLTTDFFYNYGLFAAGARGVDYLFGRYVRRMTRKRFLTGVVRSNLVLAAGLMVPMIARREFDLRTFAVDVTALGLSATAVKAAIEGTKGVYRLVRGRSLAFNLGRLSSPAGWVFTAAETAVVLLVGDRLANWMDGWLDERAVRGAVKDAEGRLEDLLGRLERGERVDPADLTAAIRAVEDGYDDLRRFQARPLRGRLDAYRAEVGEEAARATRRDPGLDALRRTVDDNPALRAYLDRRYEGVDGYVESVRGEHGRAVEEILREEGAALDADFERLLARVYLGEGSVEEGPTEGSRLATYDEETTLLLRAMDATTDPEARRHIALAIERVRLSRTMDTAVYHAGNETRERAPADGTGVAPEAPSEGAADAVEGLVGAGAE